MWSANFFTMMNSLRKRGCNTWKAKVQLLMKLPIWRKLVPLSYNLIIISCLALLIALPPANITRQRETAQKYHTIRFFIFSVNSQVWTKKVTANHTNNYMVCNIQQQVPYWYVLSNTSLICLKHLNVKVQNQDIWSKKTINIFDPSFSENLEYKRPKINCLILFNNLSHF